MPDDQSCKNIGLDSIGIFINFKLSGYVYGVPAFYFNLE
jgi:hypothetical protein